VTLLMFLIIIETIIQTGKLPSREQPGNMHDLHQTNECVVSLAGFSRLNWLRF